MYCPNCRDEFRPGFTRCGRCDVDLVESLAEAKPAEREIPTVPEMLRMGEYCGYLSIDDARHARDQLRERGIRSEIAIREAPDASMSQPIQEEYWLRVDVKRAREVAGILGDVPQVQHEEQEEGDEGFACGECGHSVAAAESFCPGCGARFDD